MPWLDGFSAEETKEGEERKRKSKMRGKENGWKTKTGRVCPIFSQLYANVHTSN